MRMEDTAPEQDITTPLHQRGTSGDNYPLKIDKKEGRQMGKKSGGLGRDFYSLLDDNASEGGNNSVSTLRIADIEPRKDQPRKTFEQESLEALAESIGTYGVLQPIIVRENMSFPGSYEIIAGERRWRAAKMAGLNEIPVVIMSTDDLKTAQVSLIENIQRENLDPVEEARAYYDLINKYDLTQDQVSKQVGKSRSNIANMLRLLDLPDDVLDMLRDGSLSTGHARALLGLADESQVKLLADKILTHDLTVRDVEKAVKSMNEAAQSTDDMTDAEETSEKNLRKVYIRDLEHRILNTLGRKAKITSTPKKKVLELSYQDDEDLEDLLKSLCGNDFFQNN